MTVPMKQTVVSGRSLEQARRYNDQASKASRAVWTLVHQSVREMFGIAVAAAIEAPLEQVTENYGESVYHYEQALTEEEERHANELAFKAYAVNVMRGEVLQVRNVLREVIKETQARHAKSGRPLPEWFAAAERAASLGPIVDEAVPF